MIVIILAALLFTTCYAQDDSISIVVSAQGTSENVIEVGQAVADAIVAIDKAACKGGSALVARTEAIKVVEAAAKATARGTISIISTGNAVGTASTKVVAQSIATAIANAIANAAASVENGPSVLAKTEAIKAVSVVLQAEIEQLVVVAGNAVALASAISEAEGFVIAVAEALAAASAGCVNGEGTANVAVQAEAEEGPAPTPQKNTAVNAFLDVGTNGFANILTNEAFARVLGGSSGSTVPPASQVPTQPVALPVPSGAVAIGSGSALDGISGSLTALTSSLRP